MKTINDGPSIMYISNYLLLLIVICQIRVSDYGIICIALSNQISSHQTHHQLRNHLDHDGGRSARHDQLLHQSYLYHHQHYKHHHRRHRTRNQRAVYLATPANGTDVVPQLNSRWTNQSQVYQNDQPAQLDQCCACDEAKYELVFEGLWSKYTHPDEFPDNYWLAYFSDIIGASHSNEFRMWQQDTFASEGVKELAETGSTKRLESELKQMSSKTRTIIKARELHYPTLNSKTSAVFRTDRQHHLVSILSKVGPSPDWMVGVPSLELCQSDCSWATQRVVNLYLWDAGTDSGTTFTAPDSPSSPQEKIHPYKRQVAPFSRNIGEVPTITSSSSSTTTRRPYELGSNNYESSQTQQADYASSGTLFAGSAGIDQSKPYARLTVTRQRIYEKSCNSNDANVAQAPHRSNQNPPYQTIAPDSWIEPTRASYADCRFTEWSDWSICSSTCGKGIRMRTRGFVDEQAQSAGCSQVDLIEKEVCLSECIGNTTCVTRDWSEWSKCSVNCGQGYRKRMRMPIGPVRRACESVELVEVEPCTGAHNSSNCSADPSPCEVTEWSQWSDCSVACGKGVRIRTRQYVKKEASENCTTRLIQKQSCTGRPELCKSGPKVVDTCTKPVDPGPCRAYIQRWRYDKLKSMCVKFIYGGCMGNSNNFATFQDCESQSAQPLVTRQNPNLPVIDCKLSAWSPWSTCSALCGNGKRTRSRYIIQMPQNGGKPCDKKLARTQKCKDLPPCPIDYAHNPPSGKKSAGNWNGNLISNKQTNSHHQRLGSGGGDDWRPILQAVATTTTTTTPHSSFADDEDDSGYVSDDEQMKQEDNKPCEYGNWTQWSECEVVCQPVKKGSNKVRQKIPIEGHNNRCSILEEIYYCDPNIYC